MGKRAEITRGSTCWIRRAGVQATTKRVDRLLLKLGSLPASRIQKDNDGRPELILRFGTPETARTVRAKLIQARVSAWQYKSTVVVHLDAWEKFQKWEFPGWSSAA